MRGKDLLKDITNIDDAIISEAAASGRIRKKTVWIKWGAVAACLCLIMLITLNSGRIYNFLKLWGIDNESNKNYAVYVPLIQLPKNNGGAKIESDMIGLVVYKGKIYTQAGLYQGKEAIALNGIIGEYLGYARGNINEWSKQETFSKEFSSTVTGDVYSVNSYSTDFRLCIKTNYTDNDGNLMENVQFYENLNGIGLNMGKDLFVERLGISENWNNVKYQEHDNWNSASWPDYEYQDLSGITKDDINSFLEELFKSKFVDMSGTDLYSREQGHLFFYMNDGTSIELRLFEGGYVSYQPLGWYCVKMPGKIFDLIFAACR